MTHDLFLMPTTFESPLGSAGSHSDLGIPGLRGIKRERALPIWANVSKITSCADSCRVMLLH
jgi:hypothetical protein